MKWRHIKVTEKLLKKYERPPNLLEVIEEQEQKKIAAEQIPAAEEPDQLTNADIRR